MYRRSVRKRKVNSDKLEGQGYGGGRVVSGAGRAVTDRNDCTDCWK